MNKTTYAFIVKLFDATKTHYSDDERFVTGYDGETKTMLFKFDTEEERDEALENIQVSYGEDAERGNECKTLWIGQYDSVSDNTTKGGTMNSKSKEDKVDDKIKDLYIDTDDS